MKNTVARKQCRKNGLMGIYRAYPFHECFAVHGSTWPYAKRQETGGGGQQASGFKNIASGAFVEISYAFMCFPLVKLDLTGDC